MVDLERQGPAIQSQGAETISEAKEEIYIRTAKGAMKGDLIQSTNDERIVRTTWTHDGTGIGQVVKLPAQAEIGKPLRIKVIAEDGKEILHETGAMQIAARGEKGSFITLDEMIAAAETYSRSSTLPESAQHSEQEYVDALSEYMHVSEAKEFARTNSDAAKCDVAFDDLDIGWKAHLNVEPKDVPAVSEYLKQNHYAHKYLSGGVGTEGKAFTVYFGARTMMQKWVEQLSKDLAGNLRRPKIADEMELAVGIVGRFTAGDQRSGDFAQYGDFGLVPRKEYLIAKGNWRNIKTREDKIDLATDAYKSLAQKYGKYFHG